MSPAHPRLPVVLVAGLHAAVRRAAVDELLLASPGAQVLHHDLSTARDGVVRASVWGAAGTTRTHETPLVNDCACCALREDLVPELLRLADSGTCSLAVVELWDSVEPKVMAEVVVGTPVGDRHCGAVLDVVGVVTAVDPELLLSSLGCGDDLAEHGLAAAPSDERTVADTLARQLEYANVLALAASEFPDPADLALLGQLHSTARRVTVGEGGLAAAARGGFDVRAAAERQHPACALLPQEADEHGVATVVWHRTRPFHPARLHAALEDLTCAAARSRGRFWLADRPDTLLMWDAAGGALCVEEAGPWLAALPDAAWELVPPARRVAAALDWHPDHGDRAQHLTFTSPGLDRDGLLRALEGCLLTDAEYAAGPESWQHLPHAFDDLLAPVR
ncbi:CobW family GTP-binding protein [Streptomyces melanogenes]|uniref:CobW family GTP-binding protein n=1 Tax=Streptomyces melanogenes TaxID=67326 RepID=UPI00167D7052|nr:GTP-binding protein [Streptomyces melanogenes]GGP44611.1 cobalamin biosynthesis protein CobW [Streptomyces melanogenes]